MIKIIHFADFHLGVDTHGPQDPETKLNGRVLDFLDSLDALVDYAIDNEADLVLFAGDAFHKHSPDPTLFREFGDRIVRLAEHCPIVLLVGNHDMPGMLEKASAIDVFSTLRVPNVYVGYDYRIHDIDTKHGSIQIATVPYPLRNQFLNMAEKKDPNSKGILQRKFSKMITTLAGEINDESPAILLGHFTVNSAVYGSETGMSAGDDAEVMVETLVNEAWDYVALGHLHLHQDLGTKDFPIVYAGSLDKVDFSEENDPKGFIWIEIDEKGTRWEQIGIDSRPFVTLEMDVSGEENHTKTIISKIKKHDLKDAVVRILIETEEGSTETINRKRIYEVLDNAGVNYVYNVIIKEKPSTRSRLDEGVDLTAMSHPQMLKTYFQTIGTPKNEIKELMSLAKDIMEEVNADQSL